MCGIIGYVGHQQAAPILLDGLARMEYRGYDSAGVAVRSETKGLQVYKSKGRLQVLSDMIHGGADVEGTLGIGHTRWATHGEPNDINAHPHVSEDGRIAMVHNGIIENYMEIKQQLLRHGVKFKSETDTEVVAQLLEFHYRECHNMLEAVGRVLRRIEGSYAFGIICADYPNALIAARKDSPLIIGCGEGENFIASDVTAVIGHNGAGKTTLSRCLCGLEKRCKGILEKDGTSYSSKQRLKLCYMVMQDVNHQLFTESVLEEVLLSMPGKDSDESPENVAKAEAILTEMDLLPYKACHPMGLSGGQKQRVAIASAIASERPVILFDEPTSGLDLFHMRQVADSVKGLADSGKTIVIVTHDPEFILRCCNHVIHLENGMLEESYSLWDMEGRERLLNFFILEGGGGNQTV